MKLKLFLMMLLAAATSAFAQRATVKGSVVNGDTGSPIAGAVVTIPAQGISVTTGPTGDFIISNASEGQAVIVASASGYSDGAIETDLYDGFTVEIGQISLFSEDRTSTYFTENEDILFDELALDEEEGAAQSINALTGASDDIYYSATSYDFQPMYFRYRGYNSEYQTTYVNGIAFNDLARGRFNFNSLGGMTSRAFRNRTTTVGLGASTYGFGDIGGSSNISTITSGYAKGFNGSLAFTNGNYMLRAMATYSTGVTKDGWALTVSAIGRWSNEGIVPGTWYNSAGGFLSVMKEFNPNHSLTLTLYGAPTERAGTSATFQEAFELTGDNLYNPQWGYQDGKKRSAKIIEQFEPTAMLNWIYKNDNTTINTGAAARWSHYSSSALSWYNAADPRPDYYRYLPSNFYDDGNPTEQSDYYANLWRNDVQWRQIDWANLYQTNYLNNLHNEDPANANNQKGSSYILENRVSNYTNFILSSVINHRINEYMSLQGGVSFNYTKSDYFKTVRDLLGGQYWLDIDTYSERDFPSDPTILQNDLNNPNRKVQKGDKFGYNYSINAIQAVAWLQNIITLPQWDINYGLKVSYTQFQRDGHMRNGRAPENSYGKGETHRFDNGAVKVGATYKLDGRNFFTAHATYETRAPLYEYAYISPRVKDTAIDGLTSERIFSADLSYAWNYRRFRGAITGFWTEMMDMTERTSFYDDQYSTFMNYVLKGVHRRYKGIEIGMAYKITPAVTVTAAGTWSRYQYMNRPTGVRSYENGMMPDTEQTVYLKNFYVGGTPQTAVNVGIDYAAPGNWYFNLNGAWMGNAYVSLSPIRHEALPDLWMHFPNPEELEAKMKSLATQDKLNNAFVLNASIGKAIYLKDVSLNINLSLNNLLNNCNIMTNAYQQGRFDYNNYDAGKFPNKYSYAQGFKMFLNLGVRF